MDLSQRKPNKIELEVLKYKFKRKKQYCIDGLVIIGLFTLIMIGFIPFKGLLILIIFLLFKLALLLVEKIHSIRQIDFSQIEIERSSGILTLEYRGSGKYMHKVYVVSGKVFEPIFAKFDKLPTYGVKKSVIYEYVDFCRFASPIDSPCYFISINNKLLNDKHLKYVQKNRYIGILSTLLSSLFIFLLIFVYKPNGNFSDDGVSIFILLGLIFCRTICVLIYNGLLYYRYLYTNR
ncbi:hypothetical protein OAT16_03600 [Prolixibacteraceae bacterium]|nr:hypothetical protein [Prolixibacteraceae bacterium]